jgi:hypothetical protein
MTICSCPQLGTHDECKEYKVGLLVPQLSLEVIFPLTCAALNFDLLLQRCALISHKMGINATLSLASLRKI